MQHKMEIKFYQRENEFHKILLFSIAICCFPLLFLYLSLSTHPPHPPTYLTSISSKHFPLKEAYLYLEELQQKGRNVLQAQNLVHMFFLKLNLSLEK